MASSVRNFSSAKFCEQFSGSVAVAEMMEQVLEEKALKEMALGHCLELGKEKKFCERVERSMVAAVTQGEFDTLRAGYMARLEEERGGEAEEEGSSQEKGEAAAVGATSGPREDGKMADGLKSTGGAAADGGDAGARGSPAKNSASKNAVAKTPPNKTPDAKGPILKTATSGGAPVVPIRSAGKEVGGDDVSAPRSAPAVDPKRGVSTERAAITNLQSVDHALHQIFAVNKKMSVGRALQKYKKSEIVRRKKVQVAAATVGMKRSTTALGVVIARGRVGASAINTKKIGGSRVVAAASKIGSVKTSTSSKKTGGGAKQKHILQLRLKMRFAARRKFRARLERLAEARTKKAQGKKFSGFLASFVGGGDSKEEGDAKK